MRPVSDELIDHIDCLTEVSPKQMENEEKIGMNWSIMRIQSLQGAF